MEILHEDCNIPIKNNATKENVSSDTWETDSQNPFNWSAKKKWRQFVAGCFVTMLVGLNSTVIATPGATIAEQFNVDASNPNLDNSVWPITAWNTGAAFGPMIGIPLLEAFGMRNGFFVRDTFGFNSRMVWLMLSSTDHVCALLPLCDSTSRGSILRHSDRDSDICWRFWWCAHELSRMLCSRFMARRF